MEEKPRKRQRRWFQFSLRTLLIVMTVCAVAFAWWSYKARQQREVVAALKKNAMIVYDFREQRLKKPPYWPAWLVNIVGVDYFANVTEVHFHDDTTDADMRGLSKLTTLKLVRIHCPRVTDAGLKELAGLSSLQELTIYHARVTDEGVAELVGLRELHTLHLDTTKITDKGLMKLAELKSLRGLNVDNTRVTDEGVKELQLALPSCKIER